jgi:pyridoxamine 5'-phosphate oxidase
VIKEIININKSEPYQKFISKYEAALRANQKNIEAFVVSSFNKEANEVDARFVNLKYIIDDEWIFFSNYHSPKAKQFLNHDQISCIFYWPNIDTQIRLKSKIKRSSKEFSDVHYKNRDREKNALAACSIQSEKIFSYDDFLSKYNKMLDADDFKKRPRYWGGFSFFPYYFEFWEGHESRINKREVFDKIDGVWKHSFLQP